MKNLNKIAAALAVAGLGMSGTAMAQMSDYSGMSQYNPSWYITPSLNLFVPSGKFGVENNGPGAGLRVGKALSPNWDVQMGLTYARANDGDNRYQQDTADVDALYLFSRDRFRPFLLAGIGAEYDKATNSAEGARFSRGSPDIEAGFGFQYQLSDQWAMQADLRDVHGFLYNTNAGFNHADSKYFHGWPDLLLRQAGSSSDASHGAAAASAAATTPTTTPTTAFRALHAVVDAAVPVQQFGSAAATAEAR